MKIQSKDYADEDPTPFPGVPGAVFTTGRGAQKPLQGTDPGALNGDAGTPDGLAGVDAASDGSTHHRSVGVAVAAVMLVAEMAGSGVLALPRALANTGWGGVTLILALCVGVGFSGSRLGMCWVMLEEKFPRYRVACRTPYPAIGWEALGRPGKLLVVVSQNITLVGVTTVFLIMSGDLLQALLGSIAPIVFSSHCYCTLLVGALLVPLSWLGTPKDFWPTAVVAMGTTVIAVIVVIIRLAMESGNYTHTSYSEPTFQSFFLGFGTILFSFGGAATFPTIQNDMRERSKFPHSVAIAFLALLLMYIPIATVGYGVVGESVPGNILRSVTGYVVQVTQGLVVLHLLTAYVILINPVTQGLEEAFSLPRKFGWQRCVVRTLLVLFEILVGLLIPDFGKILDLVGASTVALMSFVLPPICYMRLADQLDETTGEPFKLVPFYERVILFLVLLLGLLGGVVATWSAVANLSSGSEHGPSSCFF